MPHDTFLAWGISAAALLMLAVRLGIVRQLSPAGILIDNRGRHNLTHFQLSLWTIIVASLISGIFFGRLVTGVASPLDFDIPSQVLGLLGISVGSAAAATIVKSAKDFDTAAQKRIAAVDPDGSPMLSQMFMAEEGAMADKVIDITKFQNFAITIILAVAYVALSIDAIRHASTSAPLASLPDLSTQMVTLLGISHAGYIAGKMPPQAGAQVSNITTRNHKLATTAKAHAATQAAAKARATGTP